MQNIVNIKSKQILKLNYNNCQFCHLLRPTLEKRCYIVLKDKVESSLISKVQ